MIVINKQPNITHLPYVLDKKPGIVSFVPGNNAIDPALWQAVTEQAGKKAMVHHYSMFLKPIGEEEKQVDLSRLNARDFIDLVEGTMDLAQLEKLQQLEAAGDKRKTVLEAIDKQAAELTAIKQAGKTGA